MFLIDFSHPVPGWPHYHPEFLETFELSINTFSSHRDYLSGDFSVKCKNYFDLWPCFLNDQGI